MAIEAAAIHEDSKSMLKYRRPRFMGGAGGSGHMLIAADRLGEPRLDALPFRFDHLGSSAHHFVKRALIRHQAGLIKHDAEANLIYE